MNLPSLHGTMSAMRAPKNDNHVELVDLGVRIPKEKVLKRKPLSAEVIDNLFGISRAVKMNFVPQMLTALAIDYTEKFLDHCRERRISEFKKHNRLIRLCVENFRSELKEAYAEAYEMYVDFSQRFFRFIEVDLAKMWYSIGNVVNKQIPRDIDRDAATLVAIIHKLIDTADNYDTKMDKLISEKTNTPIAHRRSSMLKMIVAMCFEFEDSYGFKLKEDPVIDMNMDVIIGRATIFADTVLGDDGNVSKS